MNKKFLMLLSIFFIFHGNFLCAMTIKELKNRGALFNQQMRIVQERARKEDVHALTPEFAKLDQESRVFIAAVCNSLQKWPTKRQLGKKVVTTMETLLLNVPDPTFQEAYLPLIEAGVNRGTPRRFLAYLIDSITSKKYGVQYHGTQFLIINGQLTYYRVVDEEWKEINPWLEDFDKKRKDMGLISFTEEYEKIRREANGGVTIVFHAQR